MNVLHYDPLLFRTKQMRQYYAEIREKIHEIVFLFIVDYYLLKLIEKKIPVVKYLYIYIYIWIKKIFGMHDT